jgi:hypothetical protein
MLTARARVDTRCNNHLHCKRVSHWLYRTRPPLERLLLRAPLGPLTSRFVQDARMGSLPTLRAATDPGARGGEFFGPPGAGRVGHPVRARSGERSHDGAAARRLWGESERLTGVAYPL